MCCATNPNPAHPMYILPKNFYTTKMEKSFKRKIDGSILMNQFVFYNPPRNLHPTAPFNEYIHIVKKKAIQ